jgi:predicted phage terminase large subunit-like protein
MILTRWHHDDLAGRLLAEEGSTWKIINIPARADHDPSKGETDILGREPGEYMISARGRSQEQWALREKTAGKRTFASLYQGRPTPDSGNLFPVDGWSRYTLPMWVQREDGSRIVPALRPGRDCELVQSWDFTFKDTETSDYVVGQLWLRDGVDAYLLDMVRRKMTFSESCEAMVAMTARWPQAAAKLVEDKANGPAIMNALRKRIGGLIPVNPEGSKYARAVAITPFVEAKNVHLPDPLQVEGTAWVTDLTEEARDFPSGTHDDTVDALSQAIHRLLLVQIVDDEVHDVDDMIDEDEGLGWAVSY